MDTCSEIQSHRDSLRVTRVVQVDLLGLVAPSWWIDPWNLIKTCKKPSLPKRLG